MADNNKVDPSIGGVTLPLLGCTFVALKLTNYINWSWWLVTLPFYGPLAIVALVLVFVAAIWVCSELYDYYRR